MASLISLPQELLDCIIDHLLLSIGIQKAVLLRTVHPTFNNSIMYAICVRQVIDLYDEDTTDLLFHVDPVMKGKILAGKSLHAPQGPGISYPAVFARINQTLDGLVGETSQELMDLRRESIAGAMDLTVRFKIFETVDAEVEVQNLLCGAAVLGDLSIMKAVQARNQALSRPPDINSRTPFFDRPLTLAAARGHVLVVNHLLECGAQIPYDGRPDYWKCLPIEFTEQQTWKSLREAYRWRSLQSTSLSALCVAARGGHEDVVHLLLRPQYRLPIDSLEYVQAVKEAARAGKPNIIETLLQTINKNISDFEHLDNMLIQEAICYDRIEIVRWVLEKGVEVDVWPGYKEGHFMETLHLAATLGRTAIVRLLLERGADPICKGQQNSRRTPIIFAARSGQQEAVELLIDHGADPCDALFSAASAGQQRLVRMLLERFPDLLHRDGASVGWQAMSKAIRAGNLVIITMLVNAGVPLNNYKHPRAAHMLYAEELGFSWVVDHLLKLGALASDDELRPKLPRPPYDLCERGIRLSGRTWDWVGRY